MKYLITIALVVAVALLTPLSGFKPFQIIYINLVASTIVLWWACFKPTRDD